jgi:hypothetical protein
MQSQARKKAAVPRTVAEEVKARGAAARNASTGRSASRRGSPGRRRDDDARAYSAAAATTAYTLGTLSWSNSIASSCDVLHG